ncbi:MAG: sigma-70 family RNA polymerase sigma factor [Chloroflexi bacterium]|nr:sigma-70 family RNA polymerase sigma factor [Chloroflexota bacterium]
MAATEPTDMSDPGVLAGAAPLALGATRLGADDFTAVYEAHAGRIYGFVYSQVGNREEAEDLTSQVFLKVYNSLNRFEGRGSLEGWLFQIARVTVNDHWRERYRLPAVPLPDGLDVVDTEVPPDFNRADREARVRRILELLPPNYRMVLEHRFLKRASVKETAAALQLTETNVKVLQFRALRKAAELGKELAW